MLSGYAFIALFAIIAVIFPIIALLLSFVVRPRRPNPIKTLIYECGLETVGETWVQVKIGYYIYALIFVIFDIEVIFLYPWAVAYNQLGLFALAEMFVFLGILVAGLAYAWKEGALEWT